MENIIGYLLDLKIIYLREKGQQYWKITVISITGDGDSQSRWSLCWMGRDPRRILFAALLDIDLFGHQAMRIDFGALPMERDCAD